jgi:trans-aconitate methyltransferase
MSKNISSWDPKLYNEKHAFVYDYGKLLVDFLDPKANERILDLGCGTGELTFEISKRAENAIGIDSSPEMIQIARSNYPHIEFEIGNASDFHFDEKFDSIFSNAALHWVNDYKSAIKCMYSSLKRGGKIVLEFGGKENVQTIMTALKESLKNRGYTMQAELDVWYFPSIGAYTSELELAGFKVTYAELYNRPTELADKSTGIKDWLIMFAKPFFKGISEKEVEEIVAEVQQSLTPILFQNGRWYADYKRLRVKAYK